MLLSWVETLLADVDVHWFPLRLIAAVEGNNLDNEALVNRMAENRGRRDEWGQALEIHQQALKRCPYNSSFISGVAQCLGRLGRERELEAFLRSIDAS